MSKTALRMEQSDLVIGIAAVADFAMGDVFSDVVNMSQHNRCRFITHWGVGTTGVVKLTVQACDDVTPSNFAAVPFHYRITLDATKPGAITLTTAAAGVSNAAGSNQIIECEITAAALLASGYKYARLSVDETTDAALLGGVLIERSEPRHADGLPAIATV